MAESITKVLGEMPSGLNVELSIDEVGTFLRTNYLEGEAYDGRKAKKARLAKRLDYFCDRTQRHYEKIIDDTFSNEKVKRRTKAFLPFVKTQNLTRRVVEELSTVYSEAADRHVEGSDENYQKLLAEPSVRINTRMRTANEFVNLMNQALLWFRIRRHDSMPELRVHTPDSYDAISHPNDPLRWIGVIFPVERRGFKADTRMAKWQVWTENETFSLNGHGRIMTETWVEHGYDGMPGVLVNRRDPTDTLTDFDSGEDLTSAHEAIALLNVLLLKANKASVRAPYVAGDIGNTATGQPLDDEELLVFQDGIAPGTLDLRADPSALINSIQFTIKQVAANYGIPASVFDLSYQASSGFEIELKRTGLREKRHQQIMDPWRPAEKDLAAVMSRVLTGEYAFGLDGWRVNFGEFDTPQDPDQRLNVWAKRRAMRLMSTEDMVLADNPEFDREQAQQFIKDNVTAEAATAELERILLGAASVPPIDETTPSNGQPRNGPPAKSATPLPSAGTTGSAPAAPEEQSLKDKADAVGVLIRAGFTAESATAAVGLTGLKHLGLLPVTLKED